MEGLLLGLSIACSSILFFSVPIVFLLLMRRIRRRERAALAKHGYA